MRRFLLCYTAAPAALLPLRHPGRKEAQGFGKHVCGQKNAVFSANQMLISTWEHNQRVRGGEEETMLDPTETTNPISDGRQLARHSFG